MIPTQNQEDTLPLASPHPSSNINSSWWLTKLKRPGMVSVLGTIILAVLVIGMVGFSATLHEPAHDVRHIHGFPCH